MYLHITFKNGSNSFLKYGTEKELFNELRKWDKKYHLLVDRIPGIINKKWQDIGLEVLAIERNPVKDLFMMEA